MRVYMHARVQREKSEIIIFVEVHPFISVCVFEYDDMVRSTLCYNM